MAWYDGELFPANGMEFDSAPTGALARGRECTHDHVVALREQSSDQPPVTSGRLVLFCLDCEERWWEDVAKIKESPWAVE